MSSTSFLSECSSTSNLLYRFRLLCPIHVVGASFSSFNRVVHWILFVNEDRSSAKVILDYLSATATTNRGSRLGGSECLKMPMRAYLEAFSLSHNPRRCLMHCRLFLPHPPMLLDTYVHGDTCQWSMPSSSALRVLDLLRSVHYPSSIAPSYVSGCHMPHCRARIM